MPTQTNRKRKKMPSKSKGDEPDYIAAEPKEDGLVKDTTMKEKMRVFHVSRKISMYLGGLLFATGAISILMSAEYLLGADLLLALELKAFFLTVLGFIGLVNLICGLLLLAKE
jgi:hypothetical protein